MLICNRCTARRSERPSLGKCELCKRKGACNDVHSPRAFPRELSEPAPPKQVHPAATMIELLARVEDRLPELLESATWSGQDLDARAPAIERLWTQARLPEQVWIYLDYTHTCADGAALWRASERPQACTILSGRLASGVGWRDHAGELRVAALQELGPGSVTESSEPLAWLYTRPSAPTLTLAVSGAPWPQRGTQRRSRREPRTRRLPLVAARIEEIRAMFVGLVLAPADDPV